MKRIVFLLLAAALPLGAAYEIPWYTTDSGGGTSSGGAYTLAATVGQPDAGSHTGGAYSLSGGFWGAFSVEAPEAPPVLRIQIVANRAQLSWPNPSTNYQLQESPSLTTPSWTDVPALPTVVGAEKQVLLLLQPTERYFRLRKP